MTSGENTTKSDDWESLIATKMPSQGGGVQMSELKAYTYDDMLDGNADVDIEYYPKSEADKVIAELEESHKKEVGQLLIEIVELKAEKQKLNEEKDAEIQRLENLCESYRIDCDNLAIREANAYKEIERADKKLRRHKYKRCLANAEAAMHKRWRNDEGFDYARSTRHMKTWLELAEKFKPNSTAQ